MTTADGACTSNRNIVIKSNKTKKIKFKLTKHSEYECYILFEWSHQSDGGEHPGGHPGEQRVAQIIPKLIHLRPGHRKQTICVENIGSKSVYTYKILMDRTCGVSSHFSDPDDSGINATPTMIIEGDDQFCHKHK